MFSWYKPAQHRLVHLLRRQLSEGNISFIKPYPRTENGVGGSYCSRGFKERKQKHNEWPTLRGVHVERTRQKASRLCVPLSGPRSQLTIPNCSRRDSILPSVLPSEFISRTKGSVLKGSLSVRKNRINRNRYKSKWIKAFKTKSFSPPL